MATTPKTDTQHPCGYCKTTDSVILYDTTDTLGQHFFVNQCKQCNAIFLSPTPTEAQLAVAYSDEYYGEREDKFDGLIERVLDYFRTKRAALVAKHAPKPPNGRAKVLDIGCGNGNFLKFMQQQGAFEVHGVERPGKAAQRASKIPDATIHQGVIESQNFAPNTFDAITLFHVFEHLSEPIRTLDIIQKILKPNGVLVISFPNIDSIQSRLFKGKWLHLDPPRHLFFFTPKDFRREMEKYGFDVLEENQFSIEYNPFGMQQSLLNLLTKKREVLYEHLKGNAKYTAEYSGLNLGLQRLFFQLSYPLFILSDLVASGIGKGATVEFVMRKRSK